LAMMSSERDRQLRALEEKLRNRRGRWESFCCCCGLWFSPYL
jgi:hypothetical protein